MLIAKIKDNFLQVTKLLTSSRYVDDVLKSLKLIKDLNVLQDTEEVLKKIRIDAKGWAILYDGVSVGILYMAWLPEIDSYRLDKSSLQW